MHPLRRHKDKHGRSSAQPLGLAALSTTNPRALPRLPRKPPMPNRASGHSDFLPLLGIATTSLHNPPRERLTQPNQSKHTASQISFAASRSEEICVFLSFIVPSFHFFSIPPRKESDTMSSFESVVSIHQFESTVTALVLSPGFECLWSARQGSGRW